MKHFSCIAILLACVTAQAQYEVNWPTQPSAPMATGMAPGPQKLRISGVNDFLYGYDVNVVEIETPTSVPQPSLGRAGGCKTTEVNLYYADAQSATAAYNKLFPSSATPPQSLAETQSLWLNTVQQTFASLADERTAAHTAFGALTDPAQLAFCKVSLDSSDVLYGTLSAANLRLNQSPHAIIANFLAKSCKSEILTITESYRGVPTGRSMIVQLDAECNKFTVSGGVLLSEIQNRTYTSTTSPSGKGNFLSVSGTGRFSPTLTSLFNFNFPLEPLGHTVSAAVGDVRLGISTGPVIQLSSSQTSSFGWFAGGTISFFHLLYITPGEHFGQFADYPVGFSAPGQPIPADFGQLTPVPRRTGRFGFAITIKGWDVSKAVSGGTDQPKASK